MRQAGLFGLSEHLKRLSAHGDPLEELGRIIDFEAFRPVLVGPLAYGDGAKGGRPPYDVAARTRLRDVLAPGTTRIDYTYDFGDNWEHSLIISNVRSGDRGTAYPRFIEGERDCPPEDCGGIPGFYEMLDARADPEHPDHAEITEWLDEYDPDELDVFPIQVALGRIAARRNAAAKRIIKPAND